MQATKFQVKLYTRAGDIELEKLVPVFHEWIRTKKISDELLIDVADNRPGLLYSRKRGFDGDFQEGIDDAFRRALGACQLLEEESSLGLQFATNEVLFRVQDRLSAPNGDATYDAYKPALEQAAGAFFGGTASFERLGGEREPFAVRISTGANGTVADALARH